MRTSAAGGNVRQLVVAHRHEADGVALFRREVCKCGGGYSAVSELRDSGFGKSHRRARVEHEHHREIGRLEVLSCVETIASRVELPIEMLEIIAGAVRTMLLELRAISVKGAAMAARPKSLDNDS